MTKKTTTVVQPLDNQEVERVVGKIAKSIQAINADALPTGATEVGAFVRTLHRYSEAADHIGQSKGEAMLLAGMALLNIWETLPDQGKRRWLEDNKIKHSWAYEAMAFAREPFTREEARELGWRGMRDSLRTEKGGGGNDGGDGGKGSKKKWVTHRDLLAKLIAAKSALICAEKGLSSDNSREVLQDLRRAQAIFKDARNTLKDICDSLGPVEDAIGAWEQQIRDRQLEKDRNYNAKTSVKNATKDVVSVRGR